MQVDERPEIWTLEEEPDNDFTAPENDNEGRRHF